MNDLINRPTTLYGVLGGIAIGCFLIFKAFLPTNFVSDNYVPYNGTCYAVEGIAPANFSSVKEFLKDDPNRAIKTLSFMDVSCELPAPGGAR